MTKWERQLEMGNLLSSAINVMYEIKTNPKLGYGRRLELLQQLQNYVFPVVARHLLYLDNTAKEVKELPSEET